MFGFGADTDNTGFYSVIVPSGDYTLQFHDNNLTYADGCYLSGATGNFTTDQGTCTPVHVEGSDVGPYNVTMPLGVHITGHVYGPQRNNAARGASGVNANRGQRRLRGRHGQHRRSTPSRSRPATTR